MYIRTRQEALDALAETLQHPERRAQLIDLTVKIILCLHPGPRAFLSDCHAGLIEGRLDELARRRREMLEEAAEREVILIVNEEENRLYDGVGRALDALRVAAVVAEVFPALAERFERWEIVRAILMSADAIRDSVVETVRARNTPEETDAHVTGAKRLAAWLEQARPAWRDRAPALHAACDTRCGRGTMADEVFLAIACEDLRAAHVLELVERTPAAADDAIDRTREVVQNLRALEKEAERQKSDDSTRRVA